MARCGWCTCSGNWATDIMKWSDEPTDRSELRAQCFEIAGNRCEHPKVKAGRVIVCGQPATEMAHIYPRGMGHTGYRDYLNNVIAACELHARSTDDMTSKEWTHVPASGPAHKRERLARWVKSKRRGEGWDV